jgi:hypothetical protein
MPGRPVQFFDPTGRLEGTLPLARPEHRKRVQTFLRIAAGLEDPSAAETVR